MGHIFLEAAAPEGKLYGAWAEAGAPAVPAVTAAAGADDHAHDMADGHDHGAEGAAADKQAAGAMAMPMPAADDHAHSEGDGHVHRRRLLFA